MTSPDPLGRVAEINVMKETVRRGRADIRAAVARTELTLDAVLEKLGWSREYAEHFVQPYCICGYTRDGWEHCNHSIDLELHR